MGSDDYVVVGRVGKAHGIRGEVSVEPRTDEPDRRFAEGSVLAVRATRPSTRQPVGDVPASLTVVGSRWHQGRLLVRFAELTDRTGAEAVRGRLLTIPVDPGDVPEDPDEFYDHQLVGLVVEGPSGARVGTVSGILHGGGQDLLRIEVAGREVLFPFVAALVPSVDLGAGRIVVDDRPGLLTGEGEPA